MHSSVYGYFIVSHRRKSFWIKGIAALKLNITIKTHKPLQNLLRVASSSIFLGNESSFFVVYYRAFLNCIPTHENTSVFLFMFTSICILSRSCATLSDQTELVQIHDYYSVFILLRLIILYHRDLPNQILYRQKIGEQRQKSR